MERTATMATALRAAPVAGVLFLGAWAGCGVSMPDPSVEAIVPDRGWNGEDTVVTITGQRFHPQVALDAARRGAADVDDGFEAWLLDDDDPEVRFALSGVSRLGADALRGIVDAGLPSGVYDLLVVGPTGRSDLLPRAFTVSDLRGDRLDLAPGHLVREVREWIPVDLTLRDAHGERVLADLPVSVTAHFHDGPGGSVEFDPSGGWVGAQAISGGLQGTLGPDGAASFVFTAAVPGTYTLTARALDATAAVRSATVDVHFEPARALGVLLELPEEGFTTVAGDPFDVVVRLVDTFGHPAPHATADVALRNRCGGWMDLVQVHGEARVTVRIDRASDPTCPEDALQTDPLSEAAGRSAGFVVQPGPPAGFEVYAFNTPVVAGATLYALVDTVDAYGNRAPYEGGVTLFDSVGGVVPTYCAVAHGGGVCAVVPTVAADGVRLEARASGGLAGLSAPYAVLPEPVVGRLSLDVPQQAVAGQPFAANVRVLDRFGNALDAADFHLDLAATDELGEATCDEFGHTIDGATQMRCKTYTARPEARLTARAGALVEESPPFQVVNGRLADVRLTGATNVSAGQPFALTLAGFDAWGNSYRVQQDPQVQLDDTWGSLSPSSARLGPDGVVVVQAVLTHAASTVVRASQDGKLLGTSAVWVVEPGSTDRLRITPAEPWGWTGRPLSVRVEAVDAWGNVTPVDTTATIASRNTSAPAQQVTLAGGRGTTWFTWSEPAAPDVLDAAAPGGIQGSSPPVHVVMDCGDEGPEAVLDFGGYPEAVACFDEAAGSATIAASFAGSVPHGGSLVTWLLQVEGMGALTSDTPHFLFDLRAIGGHDVRGLVVRDDHCASEVSSRAWVGPDDGSPVGPIVLDPHQRVLDAGSGATQVVVRDVVDCARDVAAGATVRVRTEIGRIHGATPTGSGLETQLDAHARGGFVLDVLEARSPGPAALHAWVPSGAAEGRVDLEIVQDLQRPVVLDQFPAGFASGLVREVRLVFSEPLRPEDVTTNHFGVYGPYPVAVQAVRLENDDTEVVLELDPPAQGAAGTWTVHASQSLRDRAGNRLGGQWSDLAMHYNGYFGLTPPQLNAVACTSTWPSDGVFRPDGDDGPGAEAETVEITVTAVAVPQWWRVTVTDAATGAWVTRWRRIPYARFDEIAWDGRDATGRVVANGRYRIEIAPLDGKGNVGEACAVAVVVDNGPERAR